MLTLPPQIKNVLSTVLEILRLLTICILIMRSLLSIKLIRNRRKARNVLRQIKPSKRMLLNYQMMRKMWWHYMLACWHMRQGCQKILQVTQHHGSSIPVLQNIGRASQLRSVFYTIGTRRSLKSRRVSGSLREFRVGLNQPQSVGIYGWPRVLNGSLLVHTPW